MKREDMTPEMAMRTVRRLIEASWTPALKKAKPIVFDFLLEKWTLNAGDLSHPVVKGESPDATLCITASPAKLMRLLTEPGFKAAPFEIFAAGDTSALNPIIDALRAKQSALTVRMNNKGARL